MADDAVGKSADCPATEQIAMQHDLEKLQEAHDKLLQELAEKKDFADGLHSQLDAMIERNDSLSAQLREKEQDLEKAVQLLKQSESVEAKLQESEAKNAKLKQLAVKLKKELAEAKDESETKSQSDSHELKEQLKQVSKENERLSTLYQSSVRNFQNLQSDFDKLQDEHETIVDKKKKLDQDLTHAIGELAKLRVETEELKQEKEGMKRRLADAEKDSESQFNRRKELEGKIIVLTNEVEQERKKLANQAGLERTVNELRSHLDSKTTELVQLNEVAERFRSIQQESQQLKAMLKSAENEWKTAKEENEEVKEKNWELTRQLEAVNTSQEQERVRVVELLAEMKRLKSLEAKQKESHTKASNELDNQIRDLNQHLNSTQKTLSFTQQEFEAYKVKVCRVLNEKTSNSDELSSLKERISDLQAAVRTLESDKELLNSCLTQEKRSKSSLESENATRTAALKSSADLMQLEIESLKKENANFRTLSRELQCQLVAQRNQYESELSQLRHEKEQVSLLLQKKTEAGHDLRSSSPRSTDAVSDLRALPTQTEQPHVPAVLQSSLRSVDDNDSLCSNSLTTRSKRFSVASGSEVGHGLTAGRDLILDDILSNQSDEEEVFHTNVLRRNESIERLQDLLKESESGSLLLTEQNRVLKDEIRRLERAMARIEVAQNLEYLKNLLVKFISLEAGSSEKLQLVPVLKELLKLNAKEEKALLVTAARDSDGNSNQTNSWSFLWT